MIKKSITFEDLDSKQVTQDFWFNLSKAEIAKMELTAKGGSLSQLLQEIIKNQDPAGIISTFELIILKAYGERSSDNLRFVKSDELSEGFKHTDAYSELFMELVTDAEAAAKFIEGVVPQEVQDHLNKGGARMTPEIIRELPEAGEKTSFPEPYQKPHKLPEAGNGPVLEFGPFEGLTQEQVDKLQTTGMLAQWMTSPDSFEK